MRALQPPVSPLPAHVVRELVARWNGEPAEFLHEGTNSTFRFRRDRQDLILRIHHAGDRTAEHIVAELDWVDFLHRHGVAVAPPVAAASGAFVQTAAWEGKTLYAAAFRRVPGRSAVLHHGARWDKALIRRAGRTLGRMHALSREYTTVPGARFDWPSIDLPRFAEGLTPTEDLPYLVQLRAHWQWVQSLPRPEGSFGLVHGDFHGANLLVRGSHLTVIDFDGCCHNWYLSDIAKFVGMAVLEVWSDDISVRQAKAQTLFVELMRGYVHEYQPDSDWFALLPEFLRSFFLLYYFNVLARFHFEPALRKGAPRYPIVRSFVMTDRPFLELDFRQLYLEAQHEAPRFAWLRNLFGSRRG